MTVVLLGLGGVLLVVTVLASWGWLGYAVAVLLIAAGAALLLKRRGSSSLVAAGMAAALIAAAGAAVVVPQVAGGRPAWSEEPEGLPSSFTQRIGDLVIDDSTARDVRTGKVAWSVTEGDPNGPAYVSKERVVMDTGDALIALDPTSGRELWRSPESGLGVAYDDENLVVATEDEVVALAFDTGEVRWRLDGYAATQCTLGRSTPRAESTELSAVLVMQAYDDAGDARLVAVSDGATRATQVKCSVRAIVLPDLLVQFDESTFVGRSVEDGRQTWQSEPIDRSRRDEPWEVQQVGEALVEPRTGGATLIDPTTGTFDRRRPPARDGEIEWPGALGLADEPWGLVRNDDAFTLWNPVTERSVDVPEAASVAEIKAGVGWIALDGTTADFTGQESPASWAVEPSGKIHGPFPGELETNADGVLFTSKNSYPVG